MEVYFGWMGVDGQLLWVVGGGRSLFWVSGDAWTFFLGEWGRVEVYFVW